MSDTLTGWRPIESAPMDGTYVLLFIPSIRPSVQVGYWMSSQTLQYGRVTSTFEEWTHGNVFSFVGDKDGRTGPTHWMPLPEAPR